MNFGLFSGIGVAGPQFPTKLEYNIRNHYHTFCPDDVGKVTVMTDPSPSIQVVWTMPSQAAMSTMFEPGDTIILMNTVPQPLTLILPVFSFQAGRYTNLGGGTVGFIGPSALAVLTKIGPSYASDTNDLNSWRLDMTSAGVA